jgi:plastocyanin
MRAVGAGVAILVFGMVTLGAGGAPADMQGTAGLSGRPLRQVVVWLDAPDAPEGAPRTAVLSQRNLTFAPHVLVVRAGTKIDLPNDDRVFHNVFSFHDGKPFDLGLYPVGTSKRVMFDRPGLSRLFCNIHPGMAAYVMAVDTPYFGLSDAEGRFSIPAVPPGVYTYHAWRAGGQTLTGSVTVAADTHLDVQWP